jgi:hypothetical protein
MWCRMRSITSWRIGARTGSPWPRLRCSAPELRLSRVHQALRAGARQSVPSIQPNPRREPRNDVLVARVAEIDRTFSHGIGTGTGPGGEPGPEECTECR